MPKNTGYGFIVVLALAFSYLGLFLALPLATFMPVTTEFLPWRKLLVGSIFALICISGIFAVFFPEKCSKALHRREKRNLVTKNVVKAGFKGVSISFKGHHPDCGRFNAHLLHLSGQTLCAACSGLFVGALFVLVGTILYFFVGWNISEQLGFWSVSAGQIGVALGFFQFKLREFARAALNAFFVVACFLILVGADALAKNMLVDFYLIGLTLFLLYTRIAISRWDHLRICSSCKLLCELKMEGGG